MSDEPKPVLGVRKEQEHRWIRGTCKWGGVTLCGLLFVLWLASRWREIEVPWSSPSDDAFVLVEAGRVHLQTPMYAREPVGFTGDELRQREQDRRIQSLETEIERLGWNIRSKADFDSLDAFALKNPGLMNYPVDRSRFWFWWDWSLLTDPVRNRMWLTFPLWLPFLIVALPTGWLFWSDHKRRKPGLCAQCGYDLRGNTTGMCPECGVMAAKENGKAGV